MTHSHDDHDHAHDVEALDPHVFGTQQDCFGCSPRHPIGFRLRFEKHGDEVVARFTPGAQYEGPPGIMHGGLQATLVDEVAAWTIVGLRKRMGFTATMQVKLIKPVRTGREVTARGRIVKDSPRLVTIAVVLEQDGSPSVTGELVFAIPDAHSAERILERELPDEWKKLCRGAT
jgi:acyl-coenzyme A thioesterase PaaI-like protein